MLATKKQVIQIQAAASKRFQDREERLAFFSDFFSREIKSTKELAEWEAYELIVYLNTGKVRDNTSYARFDKQNSRHRTILSLCHQLGWIEEKTGFADLSRLGSWINSDRCPVRGKRLKDMTEKELSCKIIPALQNMLIKKYP